MALCSVLELMQEALWVPVPDKILDAPLNLVSQITINNLSMSQILTWDILILKKLCVVYLTFIFNGHPVSLCVFVYQIWQAYLGSKGP